jgi:adenosylmethionine-8-amino-7-oxononanoate aminotransferase
MFSPRQARSMSLIQHDRASLWHPYAPASWDLPLWEVEAADGVRLRLRDDDGGRHEVVDGMSSWCSVIEVTAPDRATLDCLLDETVTLADM